VGKFTRAVIPTALKNVHLRSMNIFGFGSPHGLQWLKPFHGSSSLRLFTKVVECKVLHPGDTTREVHLSTASNASTARDIYPAK